MEIHIPLCWRASSVRLNHIAIFFIIIIIFYHIIYLLHWHISISASPSAPSSVHINYCQLTSSPFFPISIHAGNSYAAVSICICAARVQCTHLNHFITDYTPLNIRSCSNEWVLTGCVRVCVCVCA